MYLDARNNGIKYVDDELRVMLATKNMYNRALFSSNPVCYNGTKDAQLAINCDEMCSIYCNYRLEGRRAVPSRPAPYYCDPDAIRRSATMMEEIVCTAVE